MSDQISAINDASFEKEVVESPLPVLVDFWAPWCRPCLSLAPIIEDVAGQMSDKVRFVKMDVDQNPFTPSKFSVRSIPTLILFSQGQVKATHIGALNKADLIKFINTNI